mmetsp:Transcript_68313/g.199858  ORF Transcript_68313/g.199858 Transcript_68313/m.199858 type:complete len:303 (+) Transcript_68313:914-1822(+)
MELGVDSGVPGGDHEEPVQQVEDGHPQARASPELRPLVPRLPLAATLIVEEVLDGLDVPAEEAVGKLVGVEDEGRVEPGDDGQAQAQPPPRQASPRAPHDQHQRGGAQQPRAVVERDLHKVLVEAAALAEEGPSVNGQATACSNVLRPAHPQLVRGIDANDLCLKDEVERRQRDELLQVPRDRHEDALLRPDRDDVGHGLSHQEEKHHRGEALREQQRDGLRVLRRRVLHASALVHGAEVVLGAGYQDQEPEEHERRRAAGHEVLGEVEAHVRVVEGQELRQGQELPQPQRLAREHHLTRAS